MPLRTFLVRALFGLVMFMLIAAGIAWVIIPDKTVWMMLAIIGVITGLVLFLQHWPDWLAVSEKDRIDGGGD